MSEWKTIKLGDIAGFSQGIQVDIDKQFINEEADTVRFIRIVDFTKSGKEDIRYIKNPGSKYLVQEDDLVMIRYGSQTAGKIARGFKGAIANNTFKITPDDKVVVKEFLYHFLKQPDVYQYFSLLNASSTMPAITFSMASALEIIVPSLPEQERIAEVLSSLDDKIDLLHRQNQTLEQLAETIFRQWFVEEAEESWEEGKLENLCEIVSSGGTPSTKQSEYYGGDINWYSTKELNDNFLFESLSKITEQGLQNSSAKLFPIGTVVIAIYAAPTVGRLGILATEAAFNQAACGLVADQKKCSKEFLYLFLKSQREELNQLATGSAQQNLNVGKIKSYPLLIPPKAVFDKVKAFAEPIFQKIQKNTRQVKQLEQTRDTLLPKLMCGAVRVNN